MLTSSAPPLAASPTLVPKNSPATAAAKPADCRALRRTRRERVVSRESGIHSTNNRKQLLGACRLCAVDSWGRWKLIGEIPAPPRLHSGPCRAPV